MKPFPLPIPRHFFEHLWFETRKGKKRPWNMKRFDRQPSVKTHPIAASCFPCDMVEKFYWRRKKDGGYGSKDKIGESHRSFSGDLALALAVGANGHKPMKLGDAIMIAARACERCMNHLAHAYGLKWGYEKNSKSWKASNTRCELCS